MALWQDIATVTQVFHYFNALFSNFDELGYSNIQLLSVFMSEHVFAPNMFLHRICFFIYLLVLAILGPKLCKDPPPTTTPMILISFLGKQIL